MCPASTRQNTNASKVGTTIEKKVKSSDREKEKATKVTFIVGTVIRNTKKEKPKPRCVLARLFVLIENVAMWHVYVTKPSQNNRSGFNLHFPNYRYYLDTVNFCFTCKVRY